MLRPAPGTIVEAGSFAAPDCHGYLLCIQLHVCHSRLSDQKRAELCNEPAAFQPDSPAICHNRSVFQEVRAAHSVLYGVIIITRQFRGPASLYRTWRQPLQGSKAVLIYQAPYGPTMPVRRSEILVGNGFDLHWIFALQICLCAAYEEVRSRLRSWWGRIFFVNT